MTSQIDLSQLPPPDVVDALDFEVILQERKEEFIALHPADQQAAVRTTLTLESEPIVKLLQESAYRELVLRQRVNDSARAVMLAYAEKADLENLAAFYDVTRLLITPADPTATPPVAAVYETDVSLRARTQLAMEGFSTAGPSGAYRFHSLSADGSVLDVSIDAPKFKVLELTDAQKVVLPSNVIVLTIEDDAGLENPFPGNVSVTVLSREGDGTPGADLLQSVTMALTDESVRPLTDHPIVIAPTIKPYEVRATLVLYPGPSPEPVKDSASSAAAQYAADTHRLGYDVTLSGLYSALHQPGVQRVILHAPTADLICDPREAPFCTLIDIAIEGRTDV